MGGNVRGLGNAEAPQLRSLYAHSFTNRACTVPAVVVIRTT